MEGQIKSLQFLAAVTEPGDGAQVQLTGDKQGGKADIRKAAES
jgi:hypothetical protein